MRIGSVQRLPQLSEAGPGAAEDRTAATQLATEDERVRQQIVTIGERRIEPSEQGVRVIGFAVQPRDLDQRAVAQLEPPPAEFVARIRDELEGTLRTVREAATLPWPDLTRATLAELRFHSIAKWLPEDEAAALRDAFETEMARLYEREDDRPAAG